MNPDNVSLAATAHTVEVTIDAIRDIANSTLPKAETDAVEARAPASRT